MTEQTRPVTDDQVDPQTGEPWASPLAQWRPTGESVESLSEDTEGTWMVWTRGSCHLWDIGPGFVDWTRLPGAGRGQFVGDAAPQRLTRVERWPSIGGVHFLWFDDPDQPFSVEQWRQSSTIRHIERVEHVGT